MTKRKPGRPKSGRKKAYSIKLSERAHAALKATGNVSGEIERLALALPQARVVTERPTCATCPYWQIKHASDVEILAGGVMVDGECRRYAPSKLGTSDAWSSRWCGEHPDFPAWLASRVDPPATPAQ